MDHVLIIHEVEDYEAWKKIFDDAASIRKKAGELSYQVLKSDTNTNWCRCCFSFCDLPK